MQAIITTDRSQRPRRALKTNSTMTTAFAAIADTATQPVTVDDSSDPTGNHAVIPCDGTSMKFTPFLTDGANDECEIDLFGVYQSIDDVTTAGTIVITWKYELIVRLFCTAGTHTGIASGTVVATEYYCDTIVASGTYSTAMVPIIMTGADNTKKSVVIDTLNYDFIDVRFDINGTGGVACLTGNVEWSKW